MGQYTATVYGVFMFSEYVYFDKPACTEVSSKRKVHARLANACSWGEVQLKVWQLRVGRLSMNACPILHEQQKYFEFAHIQLPYVYVAYIC